MKEKTLNRNFIFLIIGQASSMFGTVLLKFTVSLLILDLTSSAALFGTITAISYLPPVFLSPFGGIIADRKNKRNLMIALDCLYGIMAVLLVLSLSFSNVLILITVIMVGLSVVSSFETPVVQSSIPLIQEKDSLIQSNAIVSQINMLANLIGPLLAGLLYSTVGKAYLHGVQIIFLEIVGMLSDCPFNNAADIETIICSENTFQNITGKSDYTIIDMQLNRNVTDSDVNAIRHMVGTVVTFADKRMENESTRGAYYCMWVFLYGFLIVIAFITIFNIINNISLSVTARTKQYGAFRAIGLSMKQLTKMIIAEALTYTISGTVTGTILGLIFHKLLFGKMISYHWGDPWAIPWTELGIIVLIMLFSILFAVYTPVKRLNNMSIVENISAQ